MKKKMLSIILLLSLVLCAQASCSGDGVKDTDTAETGSLADVTSAEETPVIKDNLPKLDFGGETVTFLYRNEVNSEFSADSANGDIVNDAIYNSVRSVEERLNVNIDVIKRDGHLTSVRQEYMNHITSTVLAGDNAYDWVDLMIGNSPVMMREGIFTDLMDNKYIDLEKPWYLPQLTESVSIDNRLYFVSGDASLGYMKCAFSMYFNKRLAEDFNVGNLYEIVDNGEWTLDKLMEISVKASQDINSDGKYTIDDRLGFVVHDSNHPKGFWASTDIYLYKKDDSGEWKFNFGSERDADICNKLYKLFFDTEGSHFSNITNAVPEHLEKYNLISSKFASGDIFIMTAELDDSVAQLRDIEDPYGILPYPKFDTAQESYRSSSRNTHNAFSMPVTCGDPEMAGAVLEALSSSNYNTVLPAYFEIALKTKYARDDDSSSMYDLIRHGMVLDFGYTYSNALGSAEQVFNNSYRSENSMVSNVASLKTTLEINLENYLKAVRTIFK